MPYVLLNYFTRHSVPDRTRKVPIVPHLAGPQPAPQPREFAKQLPCTQTLQYPYHLSYRPFRWKRQHHMHMIRRHLKLDKIEVILLAYLPKQLFRSFPHLRIPEHITTPFRTPHKMIPRLINRMTRSLQCHAVRYHPKPARANSGKGRLPASPYNPLRQGMLSSRAASRGGFSKEVR